MASALSREVLCDPGPKRWDSHATYFTAGASRDHHHARPAARDAPERALCAVKMAGREWPQWSGKWVLQHGLPELPSKELPAWAEAPVAVWSGRDCGAVMFIEHDPEDEEEPYSVDIEVSVRTEEGGEWVWESRGGSDWPLTFGERLKTSSSTCRWLP